MVRVRWNQRESSVGLGPDCVRGCSYGLTYRNQVEGSTGQSPSDESQRARSTGQLGFGMAFGVSMPPKHRTGPDACVKVFCNA